VQPADCALPLTRCSGVGADCLLCLKVRRVSKIALRHLCASLQLTRDDVTELDSDSPPSRAIVAAPQIVVGHKDIHDVIK